MLDIAMSFFENLGPEIISLPFMFLKAEGYWGGGPRDDSTQDIKIGNLVAEISKLEETCRQKQKEKEIFDIRLIAEKAAKLPGSGHSDIIQWGMAAANFLSDRRASMSDKYIRSWAWAAHSKTRDTVEEIRHTLHPNLRQKISGTLKDLFEPAQKDGTVLSRQLKQARRQIEQLSTALEADAETAQNIIYFAQDSKRDIEGCKAAFEYYRFQLEKMSDDIIEQDLKRLQDADHAAIESAESTITSLIDNRLQELDLAIEVCNQTIKSCEFSIAENRMHIHDFKKLTEGRLPQFDEWLQCALDLEAEMIGSGKKAHLAEIQATMERISSVTEEIGQMHDQRTSYEKILWVDWNPVPAIEHHRVLALPAPEEQKHSTPS